MMPDVYREELRPSIGSYRINYTCPNCELELYHEIYDPQRLIGAGSVLYEVRKPHYCPDCGTKIDWIN